MKKHLIYRKPGLTRPGFSVYQMFFPALTP